MDPEKPELRIACVQLSPVFKDVNASIARADELLSSIAPNTLDILALPETAFTGYCFASKDDIEPYLEVPSEGPTFLWASSIARKLRCYVLIGFPEKTSTLAYNSMLIISPEGELLSVYRKHQLYPPADPLWAAEGDSFCVLDLPFPMSSPYAIADRDAGQRLRTFRLCPAICMDLSPREFTAPWDAFELGYFALHNEVDVVVCCMAWLDAEPPTEHAEKEPGPLKRPSATDAFIEVRETISYWVSRVEPLIGTGTLFVTCNRIGREGDSVFTGSSCVVRLHDRPQVLGHASKRGEELLVSA